MKEKKRETRRSKFVVSPQCIENSNHAHRHHHNAQLGRATQTDHSAAVAATDRELGRAGDGRSGESRRILTRRERGLASRSPGERERERERGGNGAYPGVNDDEQRWKMAGGDLEETATSGLHKDVWECTRINLGINSWSWSHGR